MFNQMFNPKGSESILDQLRNIVQISQRNGTELPITIYSKGIVVSGYAISFATYKLKVIDEAVTRRPELKESITPMLTKYTKELEEGKHEADAEIIVIRDAQVHYGGSSHRTENWIGNIASIDAYEEAISGER